MNNDQSPIHLPTDPDSIAKLQERTTIDLSFADALRLVASLQLVLRHPVFQKTPTGQWAYEFAKIVQAHIVKSVPQTAEVLNAGWNPQHDQPPRIIHPT